MGGGTSRFEETDWETATGKLTCPEDTVDGAPPTSSYGVYFLTKQNYTQRDYDITDADSNLIYTTKSVEGTLAWFDLLGPGIDDYKLRVQVDLARRFWIIYSYGIPAYVGQFADMKATTQLRETRSETLPCLYKKACLTVTWSRYYAIVNRYGSPPTDEELEQETNNRTSANTAPITSLSTAPTTNVGASVGTTVDGAWTVVHSPNRVVKKTGSTDGASCDTTSSSLDANVSSDTLIEHFPEIHYDDDASGEGVEEYKEEVKTPECSPDRRRSTTQQPPLDSDTEQPSVLRYADATGHVQESTSLDLDAAARNADVPAAVLQQWKEWAKNSIRGDVDENNGNPLEGILQRDTPILKCEEINSFMGQHQTMLVSPEDVKRMKEEEAKAKAAVENGEESKDNKTNGTEQRPTSGGGAVAEFSASMIAASNSMMGAARESMRGSDGQSFPRIRRFAEWVSSRTLTADPVNDDKDDSGGEPRRFSMPEISVVPKVEDIADLQNGGHKKEQSPTPSEGEKDKDGDSAQVAHAEPLVGYWIWDNTVKVHKMKMHVAAGADLALHVVLAVVTNQLRLERNVVLSTV